MNDSITVRLLTADEVRQYVKEPYPFNWWTMTPDSESTDMAMVVEENGIEVIKDSIRSENCILPALIFKDMQEYNLQIGDQFEIGKDYPYYFKVIANNLALATSDIGVSIFDVASNDYDNSTIQAYVNEFFDKEILTDNFTKIIDILK